MRKSFSNLQTAEELKEYLDTPFKWHNPNNYFHYTKLSSLLEIYKNGTFLAHKINEMNDKIEMDYTSSSCDEYFVCLMRSSVESFGMWAMYGGIGSNLFKNQNKKEFEDAYVKIQIPTDKLKAFIENDSKLSARSIAYTNLYSQLNNDKKNFCNKMWNL